MIKPLNWGLISHPMNWLTIILMLVIGGTAGHLLLSLFGQEPALTNTYGAVSAGQTAAPPVTATPPNQAGNSY